MHQYRYQKHFNQKSHTLAQVKGLWREQRKNLLAGTFIFLGVAVFGYLFVFYSSWLLTPNEPNLDPLLRAGTDLGLPKKDSVLSTQTEKVYPTFSLSIPSLKIDQAKVTTNVASSKKEVYFPILEQSIAHYKGTSLPGQEGDVFLYGHSVLPQFFNTDDYMTIFSTLHKIKNEDQVIIEYGTREYRYQVYKKEVVDPDSIEVLDKSGVGDKTLTLMTCSPPGTYLKRLVVTAHIVE
jgi:LPXTG-site transpeptidase (sortase) family protein